MSNEIGNTLLNSLNRSTFDAGNMAKVLAEAEVAGPRAILDRNQERLTTESSTLNYLTANLRAFNSYTQDLTSPELFNRYNAESPDPGVFEVTVTGSPTPATYSIQSTQMAQTQSIVSDTAFASRNSVIAMGDLEVNIAGQSRTLTVDGANNTLEGLQRSINQGDFGITASIIRDGTDYKLMFSGNETGEQNSFSLSGLAGFEYDADSDTGDFSRTSEAQDAILTVNGLDVRSASNEFDEVISGMSFKLNSAQPGTTHTLSVGRDVESVVDAMKDFVMVYNQLNEIFKDLGSYDKLTEEERELPENEFKGNLAGSNLLRELRGQIRESLSGMLERVDPPYNALVNVGVTINRQGEMELDEEQFRNIANTNMAALSSVFAKGGSSTDPDNMVNVIGGSDRTLTGRYDLEITELARRAQAQGDVVADVDNVVIGPDAKFDFTLNDGATTTIELADGNYSLTDFASVLQTAINNDSLIRGSGSRISIAVEGDRLVFDSDRYGGSSRIEMTNIQGLDNAGLVDDIEEFGGNVQGKLTMEDGNQLDIGAYADPLDGRRVKISNFAFAGTEASGARGLEFEVLGGSIGARGSIDFTQGFASRLYDTVQTAMDEDDGLIGQRMQNIDTRLERIETNREKLDLRYERMEQRYRNQFTMLQSILAQADSTRNFLSMTYNNNRSNN